jgi:hypothetical protein
MRRSAAVAALVAAAVLAPPAGSTAISTVRLTIAHVAAHCHVWRIGSTTRGAALRLTVARGTRIVVRSDCPMDFDFAQARGPRLALGEVRTFAGTDRVLTFRKRGVYTLTARNVQTPEERGLVTLGAANTLTLTVVVR